MCVRNGEERGFTASEFLHTQDEGWEKQYPYKVGKKKVYMPSSQGEAQGLQLASKYPKSTTYGRQNPIAERWNSEEQLVLWRSAWADAVNLYLEQAGYDERIDHRSHADCGLEEQPTVHEGIAARIMEKKGFLSDRCEMNRQIRADNSLLHQLKEEVKHLLSVVATNIPVILENLRDQILLIQYQLLFNAKRLVSLGERIGSISKVYKEYSHIQSQLKEKNKQRKALLVGKSACGSLQFVKRAQIDARLSGVMEDMEELKSQKNQFLLRTGCDEQEVAQLDQHLKTLSSSKDRLEKQQSELSAKKIQTVDEYWEINDSILAEESSVIKTKRKLLRPEHRKRLLRRLQETYGKEYRYALVCDAEKTVCKELKEEESTVSVASVLNVLRTSEITAENVSKHSERKNSPLPNR